MYRVHVGDTDPVIAVPVYDQEEIVEVEKHLEQNLSKANIKQYRLHVFLYQMIKNFGTMQGDCSTLLAIYYCE
ncbi:hypothetical protein [Geomicrobium sp. JCM 19038]|uniref:hypothetical protein n=1 Tax=Geomicrobium sp. JCM 19038 TaxID=1460635 RepID=UPI00045F31D8|nr:hypothetical protein [Geomicrobium sp. JCM 19038]GAK09160.1 hypothetical protein JCM19038_2982 [Geomicrobium sp. JCM 19038]